MMSRFVVLLPSAKKFRKARVFAERIEVGFAGHRGEVVPAKFDGSLQTLHGEIALAEHGIETSKRVTGLGIAGAKFDELLVQFEAVPQQTLFAEIDGMDRQGVRVVGAAAQQFLEKFDLEFDLRAFGQAGQGEVAAGQGAFAWWAGHRQFPHVAESKESSTCSETSRSMSKVVPNSS